MNVACPGTEALTGFLLGDLPEPELTEVAEHLDSCTECESAADRLDGATDLVLSALRLVLLSAESTVAVARGRGVPFPAGTAREVGETWGEFHIVREVGRGGMGVVYEAYQGSLNRHVAIKVLPDRGDPARFRREAKAAGRLHHTNIVPVFGVGELDGRAYYVMQYIAGRGLDSVLKERARDGAGRLNDREVATIGEQVARALAFAHEQGVIHRDIKPSNLLLDDRGTVWVADFGLAQDASDTQSLTETGDFLGTLRYVAPERLQGRGDARADLYGLGVTLYELACGRPAYAEGTRATLLQRLLHEDPPRPRQVEPAISKDMETIIRKAMARDPRQRYATAAALADDLRRFLDGRTIAARPVGAAGRAVRWARRRPAIAALSAAMVLVSACGAGGVVWQWRVAVAAAKSARWSTYQSTMSASGSALQLNHGETLRRLLDSAPEEHRGWEWRHYNALLAGGREILLLDGSSRVDFVQPNAPEALGRLGTGTTPFTTWRALVVSRGRELEFHEVDRPDGAARVVKLPLGVPPRDGHQFLIHPRGTRVVTFDKDIGKVWDLASGRRIAELRSRSGRFCDARFLLDGERLVTIADGDLSLRLWDALTGRELATLPGHAAQVRGLAASPEGRFVASCDAGGTILVWDSTGGPPIRRLENPLRQVEFLNINADGSRVVAKLNGDDAPNVRLWDARTGRVVWQNDGQGDDKLFPTIGCVGFNAEGTRFVCPDRTNALRLLLRDAATGKLIATSPPQRNSIWLAVFSPDDRRLAVVSADNSTWLLDGVTGSPIASLTGHTSGPAEVQFSADSKLILTTGGSQDLTMRLWDAERGELIGIRFGMSHAMFGDGGRSIISRTDEGRITKWDVATIVRSGTLRGHTRYVYDVGFSPDGKRLLSAAWDGTVRIWDVETGGQLRTLSAGNEIVYWAGFSPDGRQVFSRAQLQLKLWNASTGELSHTWSMGGDSNLSRPSFTPDGSSIALGIPPIVDKATNGEQPDARIVIKATNGQQPDVSVDVGGRVRVNEVAFRPDGRQMATAGDDGTIRLWKFPTDGNAPAGPPIVRPEATLDAGIATWEHPHYGPVARIERIVYNPDGSLIAAKGPPQDVRIWDVRERKVITVLTHGSEVFSPAFSPDGTRLAVGCRDGTIRLWDTATWTEVAELRGHSDYVHAVAFSPDGTKLASGSGDFTVRIWDTVPANRRVDPR